MMCYENRTNPLASDTDHPISAAMWCLWTAGRTVIDSRHCPAVKLSPKYSAVFGECLRSALTGDV